MIVSIIAAMAEGDRGIGFRGAMPWHLPADLARFRRLTMGHTLIMGRVTYQSLGGRTLDGRHLIVLTRSGFEPTQDNAVQVASSLEQALATAKDRFAEQEAFLGGGAQVYAEALVKRMVDRMVLTIVHAKVEADTFFPLYQPSEWEILEQARRPADPANRFPMTFLTLERIRRNR